MKLLESCFLVSAVLVLVAGMVFSADGFSRGSTGYDPLTALVSGILIVATATFAVLLAFEVYRSVKFAEAHALARQLEEEAMEEAVLGRWHRRAVAAGSVGGGGVRWRASIAGALRRDSVHGRRLSAAFAGSPTAVSDVAVRPSDAAAAVPRDGSSPVQLPGSNVVESLVHRRRQSLLARLQGVVGAAGRAVSG